ncbi:MULTISPECIES: DUF2634 domain-containing protein [unclassified Sedimentibacter]|uniref:DUF2634 domain-containing protein n=1 Tax=unclassified Sedimentibacter TaxID=2649220 RepID=UPI0027DFB3E9|nr:DUF2634 domain-containing protein [Sedimentibacter sp. MB35-C1]WMJ78507.1 DUF2634 domain-containing protein [Sedimentibacter sp. MB35-C1]
MIPRGKIDADAKVTEEVKTTRTYKMSQASIQGFTDGLKALEQAIYKVLNTEKYEYPIYSFYYGIELESLIGKDKNYVKTELKRRIRECLLRDERITEVDNFQFTEDEDILNCTFDVHSTYGNLTVSREVNI